MMISPERQQELILASHKYAVLWDKTRLPQYGLAARAFFWAYAISIGEDPRKVERADRWGCNP
ncbi:hypothetical protein [Bradyrhizobium sp. SRS-191]|uniref:hypothetical protein n=1 Tax=Bradyrhizobium sp. SRS-191 TaxID=2962606 RepID=UPI00211E89B5|nr:hypothetical protein [Bradyrhizobium sp. SRS-191]